MTEAVALQKPVGKAKSTSRRTAFAGFLMFVLLAAFAAAFYYLGGAGLVSDLVGGLFTAAPPATTSPPSSQKPGAPSVVPSGSVDPTATSGLTLPEGVDEAFARRIYAEQIESRKNIEKLVDGRITSFTVGTPSVTADEARIPVTARFADSTSGPGTFLLAKKAGKWYVEWIAGERPAGTGGLAATIGQFTDETDPDHAAKAERIAIDEPVLSTMLEQQAANQDVVAAVVEGLYSEMTVDDVKQEPGTATLYVTFTGSKTAAMKGRILCISKDIDGRKTWFVTSFSKA